MYNANAESCYTNYFSYIMILTGDNNFENGFDTYTNMQNGIKDNFDWIVASNDKKVAGITVPFVDHTLRSSSGESGSIN